MKLTIRPIAILALLVASAVSPVHATIAPASLFTDNAVLQRQIPIPVWGTADPGEQVTITIAGQTATATADQSGKWTLKLKPIAAGGPFTMTIAGTKNDTVTLSNILVGEVWVCGGQSNMEFGIRMDRDADKATADVDEPNIRLFTVPAIGAFNPQTACGGSWLTCNSVNLRHSGNWSGFTAVGYYFGRAIQKDRGVPVGIIQACKGGTRAANWVSRDGLAASPDLRYYVTQLDAELARQGIDAKSHEPTHDELKTAFDTATAKYEADAAPIRAKFDADLAAMKSKYQADVDAAKAAGKPAPSEPRWPIHANLPQPPFDFSTRTLATQLYNGIISPLIPYGIRGVIWYQGESNAGIGYPGLSWEYKTLFPTLIGDWRSHWTEGDFPFYFVQLAPYLPAGGAWATDTWAELREAQRLTSVTTPNTGMAVIVDLGDTKNVHPNRKQPVGERLALIARALTYKEQIEYSGPQFDKFKIDGAKITVTFTHADGLHCGTITDDNGAQLAGPDKLVGFAVAGADQKFHPADAVIDGNSVVISCPDVSAPVAARFGWTNCPVANLQNGAGLWASPFKTDDWEWGTRHNHA